MTWGDLDMTLISMAHARSIAVAIQTCNDTWRIAKLLRDRGYAVVDDNLNPAGGSLRGSPNWHGGIGGKVVLVTNRKVCAKWYVDDRALHYTYDQEPSEVFREVDRRAGYASCAEGHKRHWGADGAAGIFPWAVHEGRVWVLLSLRSKHMQQGGTFSTFGGAIDPCDVTTWEAALREADEETAGLVEHIITPDREEPGHVEYCGQGCGWFYQTFPVQIALTDEGKLPLVTVGKSGKFETELVKWLPLDVAVTIPELHTGLRAALPALVDLIRDSMAA